MHDRRFGIEIECNFPGGAPAAKSLLNGNGFKKWGQRAEWEGSLPHSTGVEIRSPILQGRDGFKELKAVYDLLNENGFWMTQHCGMHIHHDAPEWNRGENHELVRRFLLSWTKNQGAISPMVIKNRQMSNGYCKPWYPGEVDRVIQHGVEAVYSKSRSVNLSSLRYHGTIEIRQHEGTTIYEQAEAWILFGQKFINHVLNLKNPMKEANDTAELLRRIRVPVRVQGLYTEGKKQGRTKRMVEA
jgi:hypothetical protein